MNKLWKEVACKIGKINKDGGGDSGFFTRSKDVYRLIHPHFSNIGTKMHVFPGDWFGCGIGVLDCLSQASAGSGNA